MSRSRNLQGRTGSVEGEIQTGRALVGRGRHRQRLRRRLSPSSRHGRRPRRQAGKDGKGKGIRNGRGRWGDGNYMEMNSVDWTEEMGWSAISMGMDGWFPHHISLAIFLHVTSFAIPVYNPISISHPPFLPLTVHNAISFLPFPSRFVLFRLISLEFSYISLPRICVEHTHSLLHSLPH